MTQIKNLFRTLDGRSTWDIDPNPLYPMTSVDLFDVGSDHQTSLNCLKPGAAHHLHYHAAGADIFLILHGAGELHSGPLDSNGQLVTKPDVQPVAAGDLYSITPFEVHSLVNTGSVDLVWLNIAPASHGGADLVEVALPGT
jgi:oxalate decarboxylase/phosphoglucose isomerase-like protein (cupin superfamily)